MRRERPSEVAFLLGLTRWAVAAVGLGALAALGFGTSLVHRSGFSFGDAWISASLALWIASVVLGGIGGRSARHARYLAERLAAAGDRAERGAAPRADEPGRAVAQLRELPGRARDPGADGLEAGA